MTMLDRVPVAPQHKGERLVRRLLDDVERLKGRQQVATSLLPDVSGRVRIGDVYLILSTDPTTEEVTVLLQNARTLGPMLKLGVLK